MSLGYNYCNLIVTYYFKYQARSPKHDKDLKCFFLHNDNAYLRFYPLKVEEVNRNPYVTVFHDFLDEKEIDTFMR